MDKVKELKNTIKINEVGETSKEEEKVKELENQFHHYILRKKIQKSRSQSHWMNWIKIPHTKNRLKNSYNKKAQLACLKL